MDRYVECDCGWSSRGPEDEVVADCIAHGREVHRMDLSREQVLAAAKPADDPELGAGRRWRGRAGGPAAVWDEGAAANANPTRRP